MNWIQQLRDAACTIFSCFFDQRVLAAQLLIPQIYIKVRAGTSESSLLHAGTQPGLWYFWETGDCILKRFKFLKNRLKGTLLTDIFQALKAWYQVWCSIDFFLNWVTFARAVNPLFFTNQAISSARGKSKQVFNAKLITANLLYDIQLLWHPYVMSLGLNPFTWNFPCLSLFWLKIVKSNLIFGKLIVKQHLETCWVFNFSAIEKAHCTSSLYEPL